LHGKELTMIRRRSPRLWGVAFVAALALAGCGRDTGPDAPPEPGDQAVARIEGEPVWISDVEREAVVQGLITEGEPLEPASPEFRRLLDEVIDQKLLALEAERLKLQDEPAVRRRLQSAREQVLGDALVERSVSGAVTEPEIRRLYEEYRRGERAREVVSLRQITASTEADAQAIRRELDGGADFDALALDRSTDEATRYKGGDLGEVDPTLLPAPLARAVAEAKPETLIGPLAVDGGFAIFRVDARRTEPVRSLEEMRPQIVRFLSFDQIRKMLERLRGEADVDVLAAPADGAPRPQEPASAPTRPSNPA
jgi:peptidyl-prolyl cis-trans isomerase C